jgi:phosphoribosylformylglycinamidine cyclo-ligase
MNDAYAAAGVDIDAGNEAVARYRALLNARTDPRVLEGVGAFAGCFDFRGYRNPVLVASTDGVGTKVMIAAALGRFDTIGRDLVHHCINDIACANARPLFFLDYLAVSKLDPAMAASVVAGIAAACADFDVALLGGETAEMPGVYAAQQFDVAGTIVGALERDAMLDKESIEPGDVVIGLPANGLHTNGYSLARRVFPPPRYDERVEGNGQTVGEALLAIHPCYLPCIDALRDAGIAIKGLAHITGGGLTENVPRVLPDRVAARLDRSAWSVPPIVAQLVREAKLGDDEAHRTLNMGIGFCAIVAGDRRDAALDALRNALRERPIPGAERSQAVAIGEIEPRHSCGPAVVYS